MIRLRILRPVVIAGRDYFEGDIVEVDKDTAALLIASRRAIIAEEKSETKEEKLEEKKEKRRR